MDEAAISPYHVGRLAACLAGNAPARAAEVAGESRSPSPNLPVAARVALILARTLTAAPRPDDDGLPDAARRRERIAFQRQARRPSVGPHDPPAGAIWHAASCYVTQACDSPGWRDSAAFNLVQLVFHTAGAGMADACGGEDAWFLDPPEEAHPGSTVIPFPRGAARPAP